MSGEIDRKYFTAILGWIALIADVITVGQFIAGDGFHRFWSSNWIISIVIILGLFGAGLGLLKIAGSVDSANFVLGLFGAGYVLITAVVYVIWGQQQVAEVLSFDSYSGFAVLFACAAVVSVVSISSISTKFLRFPSYVFAIANAIYVFFVINKYVFRHLPFQWNVFIGEVLILIIGVGLFLGLFSNSNE